jgi:hypothetical protein
VTAKSRSLEEVKAEILRRAGRINPLAPGRSNEEVLGIVARWLAAKLAR